MFSFFSELRNGQKLAAQRFQVIFYAENSYYFQYFRHLYEALVSIPSLKIAYISSDRNDPILADRRVEAVYLKSTLAGIFPRLQADVLVMTMPDLQNFIIKKSPFVGKYVYVFHALVSTHQQYRAHAFDHYDTLFCTGPQQQEEIRKGEEIYSLPQKECIAYGYPLLAELKQNFQDKKVQEDKVLIAPSWYKEGILNTCILPLVKELAEMSLQIWIRPHPEFIKRNKTIYQQLLKWSRDHQNLRFDTSPLVYTHLSDAGLLITDRSGIGLEYALACSRPVLFIDTPLKIQNPEVYRFGIEPLENRLRSQLGASVLPEELHRLPDVIRLLKSDKSKYETTIKLVEETVIFPPIAAENGLAYILRQSGL